MQDSSSELAGPRRPAAETATAGPRRRGVPQRHWPGRAADARRAALARRAAEERRCGLGGWGTRRSDGTAAGHGRRCRRHRGGGRLRRVRRSRRVVRPGAAVLGDPQPAPGEQDVRRGRRRDRRGQSGEHPALGGPGPGACPVGPGHAGGRRGHPHSLGPRADQRPGAPGRAPGDGTRRAVRAVLSGPPGGRGRLARPGPAADRGRARVPARRGGELPVPGPRRRGHRRRQQRADQDLHPGHREPHRPHRRGGRRWPAAHRPAGVHRPGACRGRRPAARW